MITDRDPTDGTLSVGFSGELNDNLLGLIPSALIKSVSPKRLTTGWKLN